MCCTTLFGFIVGVVIFKVFRRWMSWRWGYGGGSCGGFGGHDGGGCGGHRRAYNRWNYAGSYNHGQGSGSAANAGGFAGSAASDSGANAASSSAASGRPIDDLVRSLELNLRQKEEAAPVFALIKQRLGVVGPRVDAALNVVAGDRFDPTPLIAQLGELPEPFQHELVEALEHLHTILISEQREQLRRELQRR